MTATNQIALSRTIRSKAKVCIIEQFPVDICTTLSHPVEDVTAHLQNSVHRHTCRNICNKNSTEAPVNMCICPDYDHSFISTYTATCRYCQRPIRWAGHVACMGEDRGVHRVLVGKPEGKRPLGRPRCRWEDNIKMDLHEVGGVGGDWMELAQDRDRWRALVGMVRNFRVS
jgi:hypothetical protein